MWRRFVCFNMKFFFGGGRLVTRWKSSVRSTVCLKHVICCLIRDKCGPCMNEIQSVTVFAPFQDKSYVLSLDKLCNDRSNTPGKKKVLRKLGGTGFGTQTAGLPKLLSNTCSAPTMCGRRPARDESLHVGTTRGFFSNPSVQGSRWSPSHVTEA